MQEEKIRLERITKKYGGRTLIHSISSDIGPGIYGLLGGNGAGKSTLMKIMIGQIKPNSGKVVYTNEGMGLEEFYSTLGYLPQNFKAPKEMRLRDYLQYVATYKGLKASQIDEGIETLCLELHLQDYSKHKIGSLSGGTLQRLGIAQAFLGNPKYVILDEPSSGLDISERRNLKEFISRKARGKTIIISTHIVSDIEYIVDHLLIIKKGRLIQDIDYRQAMESIEGLVWEDCLPNKEGEAGEKGVKNMGAVITNLDEASIGCKRIRYVGKKNLSDRSIGKKPELNDFYLWAIEGGEE